ncbi:helix-turn-helix domain-containing protein [Bacillus sp. ZZQ-131]|uniref:XRE family transcriptional regulator n=2 Tax=root TaxID=1 RepID=A0A0A7AR52_9CAUD|nr:helix-turn-helix transcriptional regulator [Bacillus thuringiensis]YP_009194018.1 helix-turn-helix domain-containing protein [Bacillus phage vB_BtS_BMBtp3]MDA2112281.1 helix-turn-helix transcriptional regulator [Bacillus cereus]AHC73214.1 XRE family transcriptional regulator [Bacillus thuringiensis serovar tenebrionis str. YBT-1765]AHJ86749.1 XRE family transcriptional regulator [Bacillus phage vB_BtS_BMBtp3]MDA2129535.1 helix-turn-helix transcriptional regulator [Bacillus cereus]MDA215038
MENAIGKRVKEIRAELKMSQSQFAESIGVSKSLISLIELSRKKPSVETINKIAKKGNVSVDYIMGRTDNRSSGKNETSEVKIELNTAVDRIEKLTEEQQRFIIKMLNGMVDNIED